MIDVESRDDDDDDDQIQIRARGANIFRSLVFFSFSHYALQFRI